MAAKAVISNALPSRRIYPFTPKGFNIVNDWFNPICFTEHDISAHFQESDFNWFAVKQHVDDAPDYVFALHTGRLAGTASHVWYVFRCSGYIKKNPKAKGILTDISLMASGVWDSRGMLTGIKVSNMSLSTEHGDDSSVFVDLAMILNHYHEQKRK